MDKRSALVLLSITLLGCNKNVTAPPELPSPPKLAADDEVVMKSDSFGCESSGEFTQALEHKARKEYSAWASIVTNKPWCFMAEDLAPKQRWTVMQVRGPMMQIGQTSVKQRETDKDRYGHHYWTSTAWGEKVAKQ